MKKKIALLLILFQILASLTCTFASNKIVILEDIDNHWIASQHKETLYLLQHLGIIKGYEDNSFRPQNQVSRQEFTTMLIKTLEPDLQDFSEIATFDDVNTNSWSFPYISKAIEKNIIIPEEYEDLKFQPEKPITRLEIAIMIIRGLGVDINSQDIIVNTNFLDDSKIPNEAKVYIEKAVEKGIIKGYREEEGFFFKPNNTATRAEAIVMIYGVLKEKGDLKQAGYYALQSFSQAKAQPLENIFNEIVFGWSALDKLEDGSIIFSMDSPSEYKRPIGYEEALALVDNSSLKKKLMLTETKTSLIYPLLENKKDQQRLIEDIIKALNDHDFSGIVMDLENIRDLDRGYRALYVEFLKELKENLKPKNFTLTVTVQPNNVIGYYDGYDYKKISEIADEINIMAHDYHERNNFNVLTDHAPLPLVKEALTNILNEGVDPNKVILGLQVSAGTQWVSSFKDDNKLVEFFTPNMQNIYKAIGERDGRRVFDYQAMVPTFQYNINEEGKESQRLIRYEDEKSMESKLLLAKYYGIKGISIWRIGEIQDDVIDLLKKH